MQKKLIALAVASAVAAPMALADVTIYGKMDVSYNFIDNDNTGAGFEDDNQSMNSNSSRLGFKGSEDLGGGLKANFLIESSIGVDGGTTGLNARNTWAGLSGGWGEVRLGRHDTPFKIAGRKTDLYESEQLGENRAVFNRPVSIAAPTVANPNNTVSSVGYDFRTPNVVAYFTPNFSGFQGVVAYIPEEGLDDGDAWSLAGFYSNGPIFLTVAYEQQNEGLYAGVPGGGTDDQTAWRFGGAYTFGDFKLSGLYQIGEDEAGVDGLDHDAWWLGGQYTFGNNQAMVTYGQSDYDDEAGFTNDREFDVWTIGLNHNFSKRTMLYARYASLDNEGGSNVTLDSSGFDNGDGNSDAGAARRPGGSDSDGFSIGMRHKF